MLVLKPAYSATQVELPRMIVGINRPILAKKRAAETSALSLSLM